MPQPPATYAFNRRSVSVREMLAKLGIADNASPTMIARRLEALAQAGSITPAQRECYRLMLAPQTKSARP